MKVISLGYILLRKIYKLLNMRLDKWLWCARFFKTRAIASKTINMKRVEVNNNVAKPSKTIYIGDKIILKIPPYIFKFTIMSIPQNRVSAKLLSTIYQEDESSLQERKIIAEQIKTNHINRNPLIKGRPTKKFRRDIVKKVY